MDAPRVPESKDLRSRYTVRTRWSDEDNQKVLNNAVYLTLCEEARHAYFSELGLLDENQFSFVLAQTNARFLRPGVGGVDVIVEMGTTHIGTSSFRQSYRIGPAGEAPWAEVEALLVAWDNAGRGKRPIAPDFRAALERREGFEAADGA